MLALVTNLGKEVLAPIGACKHTRLALAAVLAACCSQAGKSGRPELVADCTDAELTSMHIRQVAGPRYAC